MSILTGLFVFEIKATPMKKRSTGKKTLSREDFIKNPRVVACIEELRKRDAVKPLVVSDVLDDKGNQYVNLVQKGGGVLGIALVGYTYVLEQMGIRFLRLAGTSAGAINTALLAVIGNKEDEKSCDILDKMARLNFFNLVDGHPVARQLIRLFITNKNFSRQLMLWFIVVLATGLFLFMMDTALISLQIYLPFLKVAAMVSFFLSGVFVLLLGGGGLYAVRLLQRLKNSGFGINPGNFFYDWVKNILIENGVQTVSDLENKAASHAPLHLREGNPERADTLFSDVTFISSELVSQNKIQFPLMSKLFRKEEDMDTLQPAGFIRASMAIPIFFESYYINDIPCKSPEIQELWMKMLNEPDPPSVARFVDGGILSNFPIDIFYNPDVLVPRLPSFGIDLDDSAVDEEKNNAQKWSFTGYIGRIFNTIRFYYDKNFLIKNKVYQRGIGKVPLAEYNWINFFISDKDKVEMFVKGALAAARFLENFDWEDYKNARKGMQLQLEEKVQKPSS